MADQIFKKRKGKRRIRKEAIKEIAPFRYLIVCEGEKTEPNYFEGIKKLINDRFGDKIVVKDISADRIDIHGTGRNTQDLVRYTIDKRKETEIPYGHVWCVFDKDSFTDDQFNNAINQCIGNGIEVAWSNEAIELWFLLHFEYLNTGIDRIQYIAKLNRYFSVYSINAGKYEKNLENIYEILVNHGDMELAIKNAKRLENEYTESDSPSKRNPATQIYTLIEDLFEYLNQKLESIK